MGEVKYFISYAREDSDVVLKLAQELRQAGVNLWLDQMDILPGRRWDSEVEEAIKTCRGMIAVMSPDALVSNNVKDEWSSALDANEKTVIPVLIRPCEIYYRFKRLQYADLTKEYDTGVTLLLRALGMQLSLKTAEPKTPADDPKSNSIATDHPGTETSGTGAIPQEKAAAFWTEYNKLPPGPIRDAFLKEYRAMGGK